MTDSYMDPEVAVRVGPTRFKRALAACVGVAAVLAAALGVLEAHAASSAQRAAVRIDNDAVEIGTRTLDSQLHEQLDIIGTLRAFEVGSMLEYERENGRVRGRTPFFIATERADARSAEKLRVALKTMLRLPRGRDAVSRLARTALLPPPRSLREDRVRSEAAVTREGRRHVKAVFALSIVAIASALLGLAGVFGEGRAGAIAIGVAALMLLGGAALGAGALLS